MPKITVILRKGVGLAWLNMNGINTGNTLVFAWPSAEVSFMDPHVGVNCAIHANRLKNSPNPAAERASLLEEMSRDTGPYGAAGAMRLDDIIDPLETRVVLRRALERLATPPPPRGHVKRCVLADGVLTASRQPSAVSRQPSERLRRRVGGSRRSASRRRPSVSE